MATCQTCKSAVRFLWIDTQRNEIWNDLEHEKNEMDFIWCEFATTKFSSSN